MRDDEGVKPLDTQSRAMVDAALAGLQPVKRAGCACGRVKQMPELGPIPPEAMAMARLLSALTGHDMQVGDRVLVRTEKVQDGAHTERGCFFPLPLPKGAFKLRSGDKVPGLYTLPDTNGERVLTSDLSDAMHKALGDPDRYNNFVIRSLDDVGGE